MTRKDDTEKRSNHEKLEKAVARARRLKLRLKAKLLECCRSLNLAPRSSFRLGFLSFLLFFFPAIGPFAL